MNDREATIDILKQRLTRTQDEIQLIKDKSPRLSRPASPKVTGPKMMRLPRPKTAGPRLSRDEHGNALELKFAQSSEQRRRGSYTPFQLPSRPRSAYSGNRMGVNQVRPTSAVSVGSLGRHQPAPAIIRIGAEVQTSTPLGSLE